MTDPLITADLDLALDVLGNISPQITLHLQITIDVRPNPDNLFISEITNPSTAVDAQLLTQLTSSAATNTINIGEGDLDPLLSGNVNASDTCHE